ncbi:MAG: OmpA family protein [Acidobacteriota bacterium]|nr:OmpA family protein [Acidobacteriota bacterium]
MRRFLAPASLAVCLWLVAGGVATAQDGETVETRPGSTTWFGDTGLWFVPTGEILPDGKWALSGYRANFDREQGLTDISHFIGTAAYAVNERVELFGSVRVDTRIRRAIRPFFDPTDSVHGGIVQDYPFVNDFWNDDHLGDLFVGAKINLTSERRLQPVATAFRAIFKAPTGNDEHGKSTGQGDFMVDFVVSKNVADAVELSGFGGFLVRGEPDGVILGHSLRWGFGAGFPTTSRLKIFTELHGDMPLENDVILSSALTGIDGTLSPLLSPITAPLDFTLGLQFQTSRGTFIGAGLNYELAQDLGALGTTGNRLGFQLRLGHHPGVPVYVPPPPAPPAPPANRPPTVTAQCDPCEVMQGETSTVTATANDPDGDPLAYRWNAPTGTLDPGDQMVTTWTAPQADGPVPVTVTVDDGRGGTASDTVTIQVVSPPPPPPREYAFEDVHFDFDRYTLRPGATRILDEAVAALMDDDGLSLTIQGHTCNIGTSEYNQALGERRATAVRDYLSSRGIDDGRLQTVTFGEEQPLHDNTREETRRLNRRAALVVRLQ